MTYGATLAKEGYLAGGDGETYIFLIVFLRDLRFTKYTVGQEIFIFYSLANRGSQFCD